MCLQCRELLSCQQGEASPCEPCRRVVMLRHDTLQSHGASLRVRHEVRGEDLRPGEAVVAGEGEGGHHHVLPAGLLSHRQADQGGPSWAGVELAVVVTGVTGDHAGDLEVVVRGALAVHH